MEQITILIADDHPIFQRGLQQIIEADANLKIIASATDGDDALAKLRSLKPQIAVLDVDMPKRDGLGVMRAVKEENLPCAVVFLTMYKEERFFNSALDAGAKGYVLKDSAANEITNAIHAAARGENFISPALSTLLLNRLSRAEKPQLSPFESLTTAPSNTIAPTSAPNSDSKEKTPCSPLP
jgi:two-component system, NarL family, response regulator DegU